MVSVIMPAYNAEKYIAESIRSVLNQTYRDYEIIVVDDGSTDNTRRLVEEKFPQVRYFLTKNQGAARARNHGIRMARGDLVAFLDSDDLWLPEKLARQVELFEADKETMMVFTEELVFGSDDHKESGLCKRERLMKGDIVKNIFLNSDITTSTVMVRSEVFREIGCFDENVFVAEDDNLWMRIAHRYKVALLDEVLVHYRWVEGSLSHRMENLFKGVLGHIEWIETHYEDLKNHLGQAVLDRKRSDIYSSYGYYLFSIGKYRESRRYYWKSLSYNMNIRKLIYIAASFLPQSVIDMIRRIKSIGQSKVGAVI